MSEEKDPLDTSEGKAIAAIKSAQTTAIIETGRSAGKDDVDIAQEVFGGKEGTVTAGWQIMTVFALRRLTEMANLPVLYRNKHEEEVIRPTWTAHALMTRGYLNHPLVIEYDEFTSRREKTVKDVVDYILKREGWTEEEFYAQISNIDLPWFKTEMLTKSLNGLEHITRNQEELALMQD